MLIIHTTSRRGVYATPTPHKIEIQAITRLLYNYTPLTWWVFDDNNGVLIDTDTLLTLDIVTRANHATTIKRALQRAKKNSRRRK